ncbi:PIN domain-containing protein [Candidatus Bathyarchaeota archaeon]|nr:PIN domain-containing protein [Candidatus Bathyarchaeota archaeon]
MTYDILTSNSEIIDVDHQLSLEAGLLHAEIQRRIIDFGLADAYVLASARRMDARILTGDLHFKSFEEAVIPR